MTALLRLTVLCVSIHAVASCTSGPKLPKMRVAANGIHSTGDKPSVVQAADLAAVMQIAEDQWQHLSANTASYDSAVESALVSLQEHLSPHAWKTPVQVVGAHKVWELSFDSSSPNKQGNPAYCPALFDSITPANRFNLKAYTQIVSTEGFGAPIVLAFEDGRRLHKERSFRPSNGLYAAATAYFEFGQVRKRDGVTPVKVRFVNPFRKASVIATGRSRPLASNLTAMMEMNLANQYIIKSALSGLFRPGSRLKDLGLFGIDAFDPNKIPVVFVHGLGSDPSIWKNPANEILADPQLASRYQPLFFVYPSGMNVPGAAMQLRKNLAAYRARWDPNHRSSAFDRMVIVGHSMGGLLTRLQVVNSGDDLRKAFFSKPIEDLVWLTSSQRQLLKDGLIFNAQPNVERVVFVAVPHHGSALADLSIVRLLSRLVKLPLSGTQLVQKALLVGRSALNPRLFQYHSLGIRSVDMLSPEHPYFKALQILPIQVPYHSIVGDRGKGNGRNSSDGVVPYWSSHLEGAVSECVVPHGHSCTATKEVADEIRRILRLHCGLL